MADLDYIAIDSPTTRDVDDAIAISPSTDETGGWMASVFIADAARFVALGSAEDAFARKQGATVYMGQKAVQPMLPRYIAEGRASLKAGEARHGLRIDLSIREDFEVSVDRLSFESIAINAHVPYSSLAARARNEQDPLQNDLRHLVGVSQGLLGSRRRHGALAYYDLQRLILLDEEGRIQRVANADDGIGQVVVQEFMILANSAIATWSIEHDIPILFRNHQAKSAAPAAAELATSIQGWLSGPGQNEEAARQQLELILGVATYGASLHGHFGLNLPSYTHGTSPIRRYADLVTQRQLRAAIVGESLPYRKQELEEIAGEVNETLSLRKEERKQGFKQTIVRRATAALANDRFDRLADHELSQALKLASEQGEYPGGLIDVVAARIREGVLSDKVFDRLIDAPAGTLPMEIREAWAQVLTATPYRSGHLLNHVLQAGTFTEYKVDASRSHPDSGPFIARASIKRASDGQLLEAVARHGRKQDAANLAAGRLVMAHIGVEPPPAGGPAVAQEGPGGNSKGKLQERCQKGHWALPRYETVMEGPTNAAVFACTVTLEVAGQVLRAESKGARTRIAAEQSAAEAMLAQLPRIASSKPTAEASSNPIGTLQELCQKAGASLPQYVVVESGDGAFVCQVSTPLVDGQVFEGSGANKAEAKKMAAKAACAAISG